MATAGNDATAGTAVGSSTRRPLPVAAPCRRRRPAPARPRRGWRPSHATDGGAPRAPCGPRAVATTAAAAPRGRRHAREAAQRHARRGGGADGQVLQPAAGDEGGERGRRPARRGAQRGPVEVLQPCQLRERRGVERKRAAGGAPVATPRRGRPGRRPSSAGRRRRARPRRPRRGPRAGARAAGGGAPPRRAATGTAGGRGGRRSAPRAARQAATRAACQRPGGRSPLVGPQPRLHRLGPSRQSRRRHRRRRRRRPASRRRRPAARAAAGR